MKSDKLAGIEAGRGLAALLVLGVHTRDHLFKNFGLPVTLDDLFVFGHAGVDFFFVLSGFIILHVHANDIGRPSRLSHYLQRRFTRVYPFYWIIVVLTLISLAISLHHHIPSLLYILRSASLAPIRGNMIVPVAWTLRNEVLFYGLFATIILNRNLGLAVLATWLLTSLLKTLDASLAAANPLLTTFNIEFFFGLSAAWLVGRRRIPVPFMVLASGAAVFFLAGAVEDARWLPSHSIALHGAYAFGAFLAIIGLVEAERQGRLRVPRILAALGSASYAIYLTHLLTIGLIWQVLLRTRLDLLLPIWVQFTVLYVGGATVGVVISRLVEQPFLSFVRNLLRRRTGSTYAIPTANGGR